MEQNLVSDEELIKRINDVLNDSKEGTNAEDQLENSSAEKFHDVSDYIEGNKDENNNSSRSNRASGGFDGDTARRGSDTFSGSRDLELENQILASQLEAERKKSRDLQSKFQLFENSVKYFDRLNGQLETIKQTVEDCLNDHGDSVGTMHKLKPKTVHTAVTASGGPGTQDGGDDGAGITSEPHAEEGSEERSHRGRKAELQGKDEVAFRDAEDFKQLEQDLEIVRDRDGGNESETEKVFITKTEKKCLEDIGNLASRMRTPLDDKHQRFYEKDRRRFANRIVMPETQEVDRTDLTAKSKEAPVNITSTELDGLRSYLLQLKELIARRETAWARTTERDYNQRVEITRFKNEVSHLRMLCEKRQKDIKERDQVIVTKDEEIKELQKRVQSLKSALLKLERKDERLSESLDGLTNEVLENSQMVQKSYNVMKRATLANKGLVGSLVGSHKNGALTLRRTSSGIKEGKSRKVRHSQDKLSTRKIKSTSSNSNDEESALKPVRVKSKTKMTNSERANKGRAGGGSQAGTPRKSSIERVDEKLQRIEEMLHSDVLKGDKKRGKGAGKADAKGGFSLKGASEVDPFFHKKFTPSNSRMRQELLGAMTGVGANSGVASPVGGKAPAPLLDPKRTQGNAAMLANALLSARNNHIFNF